MWGERVGLKDMSDLFFTFLNCPFNLLQISKGVIHRSQTNITLGHNSGTYLSSEQFSTYSDSETDKHPNQDDSES